MQVRVAVFAFTNDSPDLDTGVTTYNQELVSALCRRFPDDQFTLYLASKNSARFAALVAPNLRKVVIESAPDWNISPFAIGNGSYATMPGVARFVFCEILKWAGLSRATIHRRRFDRITSLENHDVVLYSVFGYLPHFPLYVTRQRRHRCIAVLHDIRVLYGELDKGSNLRGWLSSRLHKYLIGRILVECDISLVPSRFIAEFLAAAYGDAGKRVGISYAVPQMPRSESFDPSPRSAGVSQILGKGEPFLYYPSTIVATKNHLMLVRAIATARKTIPDIKLVLSGSNWNSALGKEVQGLISQADLQDRIVHLGFVSESEKVGLYKSAVALVIPSIGESFSLPVWEAFAFGCPVVASTDRDIPEQVTDAALPCNPHDELDIARAIVTIWTDEAVRKRLVDRGHERYFKVRRDSLFSGWEMALETEREGR